jgi:hypothetical protein
VFHEVPGNSEAVLSEDWNVVMILLAGSQNIDSSILP